MASTSTRSTATGAPAGARDARLAELVAELAGCDGELALDAVQDRSGGAGDDDPLGVVARALTDLRHHTEPEDRFRVAGFLRPQQRLPRRRTTAVVDEPPEGPGLVHHGSLRRWDRTGGTAPADVPGDDDVIDLRDDTARFRRPGPTDLA